MPLMIKISISFKSMIVSMLIFVNILMLLDIKNWWKTNMSDVSILIFVNMLMLLFQVQISTWHGMSFNPYFCEYINVTVILK